MSGLIKIFQNGQFLSQHEIEPGNEYILGRGESAQIRLPPEPGISRHHCRILIDGSGLRVESLSRHGDLVFDGGHRREFAVGSGGHFQVPPFEVYFEQLATGTQGAGSHSEKTQLGAVPTYAYLIVKSADGNIRQSFRLEGQAWIAGRDPQVQIPLNNSRISRRQFELQVNEQQTYLVRDLGSVNPTLLNGRKLSDQMWTELRSGDVLTAGDWQLELELRDASFDDRLGQVDPQLLQPLSGDQVTGQEGFFSSPESPSGGFAKGPGNGMPQAAPLPLSAKDKLKERLRRTNPVQLLIGLILVVAIGFFVIEELRPPPVVEAPRALTPFDRLSPEQKQVVKQLYQSAQGLLDEGRWELSRQELSKLHQIIPFYEDSKKLEERANLGLSILAEQEKLEAERRRKEQVDAKISAQLEICQKLISPTVTVEEIEQCLAPVMEFDPENEGFRSLKAQAMKIAEERQIAEARKQEYREQVAKLKAMYKAAQAVEKKGLPIPAIKAYRDFAKSKLPDPTGLRKKAIARADFLQSRLDARQIEIEKKADLAASQGLYKKAVQFLQVGIKVNPANEVIKGKHAEYLQLLRKQMQVIYQDAIIEESIGNVASAKEKWTKIQEMSLAGEDYFEKSKMKLKRYGALE